MSSVRCYFNKRSYLSSIDRISIILYVIKIYESIVRRVTCHNSGNSYYIRIFRISRKFRIIRRVRINSSSC